MLWILITLLLTLAVVNRFYLGGEDLSRYDEPIAPLYHDGPEPREALQGIAATMAGFSEATEGVPYRQRLAVLRGCMDSLSDNTSFDGDIAPLEHAHLGGEWLIPRQANHRVRLLYLHGGAWMMGSARSHRAITARLATIIGGPVLALDYRLMPEHHRRDGIQDCRDAYHWLLENGPQGSTRHTERLYIAGDSAGGNLTLSLLNWINESGLRLPHAVVALSPATDCTFSSPSLRNNLKTDLILGGRFGHLATLPGWALRWFAWFSQRSRPSDPDISPIYADLTGLPPVLLQASASEMLLDDARRYVNKARSCNSPVQLQTWPHMVHVWHLFASELAEGEQAFAAIEEFLAANRKGK